MQFAWKLGVVALLALALTVLPGGGGALDVVLAFLSIVFLAAIAFLGYRLYSQYRIDLESLEPNVQLALYGSVGLAVLAIVWTERLFDVGGAGIVGWFALLALCSYGIYWVWTQYRSYG
jgi:uncharacterized protein involved in cysteine biosynthesis